MPAINPSILLFVFLGTAKCQKGFFWQLTDMHVDMDYSSMGGDPQNGCHKSSSQHNNLSDYGDFRCDAPWDLIERTIQGMSEIKHDPDFIIWNGDSSTHIIASERSPPMSYVTSVERKIVKSLLHYFPNTTIIPVLGNHDSSPPDFFPDTKEDRNTSFYRDYFHHTNWSQLIKNPTEQEKFQECGYYKSTNHGKVFILLNTNLYYQNNNTGIDPCDQLRWFKTEMSEADPRSVILVAHVPPGYYERTEYGPFMMTKGGDYHYNEFYIDIVTKYADKIFAQFYGHTHTDSFRLFGYPDNISTVAFIAPSVTPKVDWYAGTYPSIRLYKYEDKELLNYKQYYFNITEEEPSWREAYDFGSTYGVKNMSIYNLKNVFDDISKHPTVFAKYYELNTVFHREPHCNKKCIHTHLCGLSQLRVEGMKKCLLKGREMFPILELEMPEDSFFLIMKFNSYAQVGIYMVVIAPIFGFLVSFAYLIRVRRLRIGRGYQTVPLVEEI